MMESNREAKKVKYWEETKKLVRFFFKEPQESYIEKFIIRSFILFFLTYIFSLLTFH